MVKQVIFNKSILFMIAKLSHVVYVMLRYDASHKDNAQLFIARAVSVNAQDDDLIFHEQRR
jgi:hypothetical protein